MRSLHLAGHVAPGEPPPALTSRCAACHPHIPGEPLDSRVTHGLCARHVAEYEAQLDAIAPAPDPVADVCASALGDRFRDLDARLPTLEQLRGGR